MEVSQDEQVALGHLLEAKEGQVSRRLDAEACVVDRIPIWAVGDDDAAQHLAGSLVLDDRLAEQHPLAVVLRGEFLRAHWLVAHGRITLYSTRKTPGGSAAVGSCPKAAHAKGRQEPGSSLQHLRVWMTKLFPKQASEDP